MFATARQILIGSESHKAHGPSRASAGPRPSRPFGPPRACPSRSPCGPGAPACVSSRAARRRGRMVARAGLSRPIRVTVACAGSEIPARARRSRQAGGSDKPNAARILGPGRASAPCPIREPPVPPRKATERRQGGVPNDGPSAALRAASPGDPPPPLPCRQPCVGPPPALAGRQAFRRGPLRGPRQKPSLDFRHQDRTGITTKEATNG